MPELPEVETIASQLNGVLPGKVVKLVEVLRVKSAQSDLEELVGKQIHNVSRFAKYIEIGFENWDKKLLVHLKMTGQLIFDGNDKFTNTFDTSYRKHRIAGGHPSSDWVGSLPSKHTRIWVEFVDGSKLFFNDMRVFGWWRMLGLQELKRIKAKLPPDVVDREFTSEYLARVINRSTRPIKLVILDQQKMGGMGNIYANDALWKVGIDPRRPANKLSNTEVAELAGAMVEVLDLGIAMGGASYSNFVDVDGMGGNYQEHFLVYDRKGEPCKRKGCGGVIEKIKIGGRGTYFCPKCQK